MLAQWSTENLESSLKVCLKLSKLLEGLSRVSKGHRGVDPPSVTKHLSEDALKLGLELSRLGFESHGLDGATRHDLFEQN